MMSPFLEDSALWNLADELGLELSRYESIEITDESAILEAGMMRWTPDYPRIRKALRDGAEIPGARIKGVEYKLRRPV